jgi:hypothetical protein
MTDTQLYLAIGVPVAVNTLFNGVLLFSVHRNLRALLADLKADLKLAISR